MVQRRLLIGLAKYALGLGLLAFVVWQNWAPAPDGSSPGLAGILRGDRPLQVGPLLCASVLCLVSVLLTFVRWYWLVRAQDLPFTPVQALRLGLIGFYLSTFLPGSVGGDIIKAAFIARAQRRRTVAVATVIVDRLVGLWALFWLVTLLGACFWVAGDPALHQQWNLKLVVLIAGSLVAFTSILWCGLLLLPQEAAVRLGTRLERLPRLGQALAELWGAVWMYRNQWRSLLAALLLSLVSHCGFVLTFWFAAQTFQDPAQLSQQLPSLTEHFLLVPAGMTWQALFPSPGGVGGGELGYNVLYGMVHKPPVNGVIGSLTQRMIMWILGLVGYLVYLRMRTEVTALAQEERSEPATHQQVLQTV